MRRLVIVLTLFIILLSIGFIAQAQDNPIIHTVAAGENLFRISLKYNVSMQEIASANNIANVNLIFTGQQLTIPGTTGGTAPPPAPPPTDGGSPPPASGASYTVAAGDTLGKIARQFGTTYQAIAAANNIANVNLIFPGQVLTIPGATGTAPPPPNTAPTTGFELGGQALSFAFPDQMRGAGMTWAKRQVVWNQGDAASNFQGEIDGAHSRGFKVLLSVIGHPSQLGANPAQYYQDYANFVGGLAAGGADGIEVWNEQNIDREWPAGLISGSQYTQMLSAAFQAIKANNSNTLVVSGAPAPTGAFGGCSTNGCNDDAFIQAMAASGAANFMDCVGIHYNAGAVPPSATSGAPVGSSGHYSWYYPSMVSLYSGTFPGKPLCFTELGYLTGEGYGGLPASFSWASGNTVGEQAAWLNEAVRIARQGGIRLLIVWNVDSTNFGDDPQAGYAIVRPDGTCPACNTLQSAMQ